MHPPREVDPGVKASLYSGGIQALLFIPGNGNDRAPLPRDACHKISHVTVNRVPDGIPGGRPKPYTTSHMGEEGFLRPLVSFCSAQLVGLGYATNLRHFF